MIQPFKPEHIRRYLSLYGGIVILMVLFYFINTVFNPPREHERKHFNTERNETAKAPQPSSEPEKPNPFKLLPAR